MFNIIPTGLFLWLCISMLWGSALASQDPESNKARLTAHRDNEAKQERHKSGEPCRDWDRLLCQKDLELQFMTSIKITDKSSEKSERVRLMELKTPLDQLVSRVLGQKRRLESAILGNAQKKAKALKAEEEKAAAMEEKRHLAAMEEQEALARKRRRPMAMSFKVLDVPDASTPMEIIPKANLQNGELHPDIWQVPFRSKGFDFNQDLQGM